MPISGFTVKYPTQKGSQASQDSVPSGERQHFTFYHLLFLPTQQEAKPASLLPKSMFSTGATATILQ